MNMLVSPKSFIKKTMTIKLPIPACSLDKSSLDKKLITILKVDSFSKRMSFYKALLLKYKVQNSMTKKTLNFILTSSIYARKF